MKKKVMLVINQLHGGGAERTVSNLSLALDAEFEVYVVVYKDADRDLYPHGGKLLSIALPYAATSATNGAIARLCRFVVLAYKLRRLKKKLGIDVTVSFMEASNIVNIYSRIKKEKVVLSVRTVLSAEMKDVKRMKILQPLVRKVYNKADVIVCPSNGIAEDLVQHYSIKKSKLQIVSNFIDVSRIRKLSFEAMSEPFYEEIFKNPVIINVGRLSNPKGQVYLCRAFKMVVSLRKNVKLVLVGDGPLKVRLKHEMAALELEVFDAAEDLINGESKKSISKSQVFLVGSQINPFQFLRRSSVFVSTSIYEGFPNVLIEAMACEVPVIASDCVSGPREILLNSQTLDNNHPETRAGDYGVLMPRILDEKGVITFDDQTWAKAILHALEEDNLFYRKQAVVRANHFDKALIVAQWSRIINESAPHQH